MPSVDEDVEKRELSCTVGGKAGWYGHCRKEYEVSSRLERSLPYNPMILLLGIYLKKPKTLIQKNMCTPMFTAALFTIAKLWK